MQQVIDAHLHLSEKQNDALIPFARLNALKYTLEEVLSGLRKNNIVRGLLLSPPMKRGAILPNEKIIALCKKSGGKLAPGITIEPTTKAVKAGIKLAKENKRQVKAFKIRLGYVNASAESPVFDPLYEYAESERLPVLFHTGDTAFSDGDLLHAHPLALDGLANKREKLVIVLCHFGNPWFEDAAELIYKHPNVYADTSGLITGGSTYPGKYADWLAQKISDAIYFVGNAGKVIFGTDYPVTKHSDALDLIRKLEINESDKKKILWSNAQRVFNL
ncbi:MAG TPA: amidohydrolase family protein [Candidatus Bathyarchaeia archaeon]|nr:amidohydrolase family protein [Candidatus Bathyarchaeia archaeon]